MRMVISHTDLTTPSTINPKICVLSSVLLLEEPHQYVLFEKAIGTVWGWGKSKLQGQTLKQLPRFGRLRFEILHSKSISSKNEMESFVDESQTNVSLQRD